MIRKIVFFLILFFYVYPIFFGFSPIPNDRILQIVGLIIFVLTPSFRKIVFSEGKLYLLLFCQFIIFFLAIMAQSRNYGGLDTYYIKEAFNIFLYLFSAYLVIWSYRWAFGSFSFIGLLDRLVGVFLAQAIISFLFFFIPGIYEVYLSFLKAETNQGLFNKIGYLTKRLMGVGSNFFSGVVKYGYGLLILTFLPYFKQSYFSTHRVVYFGSLLLVTCAGLMTGRFFFIAILLIMVMYSSFSPIYTFRLAFKIIPIAVIGMLLIFFFISTLMESSRTSLVFNYVFELFVNYSETGELSTSSSDGTLSMYIFPDNISTWLFGDGKIQMSDGSYYMRTDVGYIRLLFYFGIISTIVHFIMQFTSYNLLKNMTQNPYIRRLSIFMFLWVLLLNVKGLARGDEFLILLFLGLTANKNLRYEIS